LFQKGHGFGIKRLLRRLFYFCRANIDAPPQTRFSRFPPLLELHHIRESNTMDTDQLNFVSDFVSLPSPRNDGSTSSQKPIRVENGRCCAKLQTLKLILKKRNNLTSYCIEIIKTKTTTEPQGAIHKLRPITLWISGYSPRHTVAGDTLCLLLI